MERRGIPKPRKTRTWRFKLVYEDRGYACTDERSSLKPGCRQELYCPECDAGECLFGGLTFKQVQAKVKVERKADEVRQRRIEACKRAAGKLRAAGLSPRGVPLIESCWNCAHIRQDGSGYLCRFKPLARPVCSNIMGGRRVEKTGCQSFELRRFMEIEKLG